MYDPDVELLELAREGERSHLQEAELFRRAGRRREVHGELDLHGRARPFLANLQKEVEDLREREQPVFEHGREAHEAHALAREAVIDGVVLRRERRAHTVGRFSAR